MIIVTADLLIEVVIIVVVILVVVKITTVKRLTLNLFQARIHPLIQQLLKNQENKQSVTKITRTPRALYQVTKTHATLYLLSVTR
jgi:hypothetical protein